ncbi:hypothetical protein REPUB_Repub06bG0186100 [Reevesia pubescens]
MYLFPRTVSKPPASIPPGFSASSRAAPPGFSTSGRMHLALDTAGLCFCFLSYFVDPNCSLCHPASHLLQTSEPQIKSIGGSADVEFLDPAILEVGKGVTAAGLNNPGFGTRTSAPHHSSFDHDARLELLIQQSLYAHQSLPFQDHSRNRISHSNDAYSIWNEGTGFNDPRLSELLKNGGLGFNKLTPNYEDLKCQLSSSSSLYNRGKPGAEHWSQHCNSGGFGDLIDEYCMQ